jgi:biopolymer transport protein ExbD
MSFLNEEDLKGSSINLAPMIDFLFLMVVFFATMAVSRIATKDTEIELVKIEPSGDATASQQNLENKVINIAISESGEYKWVTEIHDYRMESAKEIGAELRVQHQRGLLPEDKSKTKVLLKIDKKAEWEPILKVIFAVKEQGFEVRPVYEPEENKDKTEVALGG